MQRAQVYVAQHPGRSAVILAALGGAAVFLFLKSMKQKKMRKSTYIGNFNVTGMNPMWARGSELHGGALGSAWLPDRVQARDALDPEHRLEQLGCQAPPGPAPPPHEKFASEADAMAWTKQACRPGSAAPAAIAELQALSVLGGGEWDESGITNVDNRTLSGEISMLRTDGIGM